MMNPNPMMYPNPMMPNPMMMNPPMGMGGMGMGMGNMQNATLTRLKNINYVFKIMI